jgi:hypothetical protein
LGVFRRIPQDASADSGAFRGKKNDERDIGILKNKREKEKDLVATGILPVIHE